MTRICLTVGALVLGVLLISCKRKDEETLHSPVLKCQVPSEATGAWSRVILPDEILGSSGVGMPQYFFSDGERLGMYGYMHWAEIRPGLWDWKVQRTEREQGYDFAVMHGVMSPDFFVAQGGVDTSRTLSHKVDILDFSERSWTSLEPSEFPELENRSYVFAFLDGSHIVFWGNQIIVQANEAFDSLYENRGTTFDGHFFDPVSRSFTRIDAPRPPYGEDAGDKLRQGRSLYAMWTGDRLYAWGVDPADDSKWGYYYSKDSATWTPFNVEGAPGHGGQFRLVYDGSDAIYHVGGAVNWQASGEYVYLREVWRYRLSTDSWEEIEVPDYVDPFRGVWMDGKLYVFGECASGAAYDPATDEWTLLPAVQLPSSGNVYTAGGRIFIGQVEAHPNPSPYVWIYDPSGATAPAGSGQSLGWGGSPN